MPIIRDSITFTWNFDEVMPY